MSNLEKPVTALTPSDRATLKKYLGKPGRPYPIYVDDIETDVKGGIIVVQRLKQHVDFSITSDRHDDEVFGMAVREMPSPGMLPLFYDAVCMRDPDNKRRIQYLKGFAGAGKTYMSEMIARLRSEKGAIKVDCGGKNLSELLYETVLDFNSGRSLYNEIDKRIVSGTINPVSLGKLKDALGDAYADSEGKIKINWQKISGKEKVSDAINAIREVAQAEGLSVGGNSLGMATQEGPLIRAWKEGREIVLDEFNRGKPGSSAKLHGILQFIAGEISFAIAENTLKEKGDGTEHTFTFRREDMKPGFFVTLTGNAEEDGSDVEELPQSLSSRVIPKHIPHATVLDWQHRWCQALTGLPISTLYQFDKARADANPDGFRRKLLQWRTAGLTKDQIANIPDLQFRLIERWQDVVEATSRLAQFYYGWNQIINPDAKITRSGNLNQVLQEINDRYSREQSIDFRKIFAHLEDAMHQRIAPVTPEEGGGINYSEALDPNPHNSETEREDIGLNFGTRLVSVILRAIADTSHKIGKTSLFTELVQHAANNGLLNPKLEEGRKSNLRSVSDLLNDNPYDSPVADIRARIARDMFCAWLRSADGQVKASNDEVMTVARMREAIETENEAIAEEGHAVIFNPDRNTAYQAPLVPASVVDSAEAQSREQLPAIPAEQLVSRAMFLYALAAPALRKGNLETLWARTLSAHCTAASALPSSEGLAMAEGHSQSEVSVTTVMLAEKGKDGKDRSAPLHVVWNKACDRVLVVGQGAVAPDLRKAFSAARVVYVDSNEKDAVQKISAGLARVIGAAIGDQAKSIKAAFQMRAQLPSAKDDEKSTVGEFLARQDMQVFLPVYLLKPAA